MSNARTDPAYTIFVIGFHLTVVAGVALLRDIYVIGFP